MKITDLPTKFNIPFANAAGVGYVTDVPEGSLIGSADGRASLTDGFPPLTFTAVAAGGDPPWGADMNGILRQITRWSRWVAAGGAPAVAFDSSFATAIGGYPKHAIIRSATQGHLWLNTADDNLNDPDAGGAGWQAFPDVLIQAQAGNFSADSGAVNAAIMTLWPFPASWAAIEGAPLRFKIGYTNTSTTPTLKIVDGATGDLGNKTLINSDGSAIQTSQLVAGMIVEGIYDSVLDKVQVISPVPNVAGGGSSVAIPSGMMALWPTDIPPTGWLECNGASLLISAYPNLYNAIQKKYGGDATHFNLPDFRGRFIRGWDHGAGRDLSASSRTNRGDGTTGDHVGTLEASGTGPISFSDQPAFYTNVYGTQEAYYGFNPYYYTERLSYAGEVNHDANRIDTGYNSGPGAYSTYSLYGKLTLNWTGGGPEPRPININAMVIIAT